MYDFQTTYIANRLNLLNLDQNWSWGEYRDEFLLDPVWSKETDSLSRRISTWLTDFYYYEGDAYRFHESWLEEFAPKQARLLQMEELKAQLEGDQAQIAEAESALWGAVASRDYTLEQIEALQQEIDNLN